MTDTAIKLITTTPRGQDEYGVWRGGDEVSREIPAQISSITRAEFFAAGKDGYKPDMLFRVADVEFRGESLVEYEGRRYVVYRTYREPGTDYTELYVQRKEGVANG